MADSEIVDYENDDHDMSDGSDDRRKTEKVKERRTKGRGRGIAAMDKEDRYTGKGAVFEKLNDDKGEVGPAKSVEGWIIFVTGIHEEAQEDDILDQCAEFGPVKNIHVNLDRRSGFVKGYALVEYENQEEAREAIKELNDSILLGQKLKVDWAFRTGTGDNNSSSRSKQRSRRDRDNDRSDRRR